MKTFTPEANKIFGMLAPHQQACIIVIAEYTAHALQGLRKRVPQSKLLTVAQLKAYRRIQRRRMPIPKRSVR